MLEFVFSLGYIGLFVVCVLGATIVPLATEAFVWTMPLAGYNIWTVVTVAAAGNFVGNLINYYVGLKGTDFILSRYIKIKEETWARAENLFRRYGVYALFFSWLPIIGDPLTIVAGAFHTNIRVFSFWVLLGKVVRYVLLVWIGDAVFHYF